MATLRSAKPEFAGSNPAPVFTDSDFKSYDLDDESPNSSSNNGLIPWLVTPKI